MTWTETIPEDEEKRTYRSASYPRKALFASAGSLMHVVMALLLAWAALTFVGLPRRATSAWRFHEMAGTPGERRATRRIESRRPDRRINGVAITSDDQLISVVSHDTGKRLTILIQRPVVSSPCTPRP